MKVDFEVSTSRVNAGRRFGQYEPSNAEPETFLAVFCRCLKTSEVDFERQLILQGVHAMRRPIFRLLIFFHPDLLCMEHEYLASLRSVRSRRQFALELAGLGDFNRYSLSVWRVVFGLRLSVGRLMKLRELLPEERGQHHDCRVGLIQALPPSHLN